MGFFFESNNLFTKDAVAANKSATPGEHCRESSMEPRHSPKPTSYAVTGLNHNQEPGSEQIFVDSDAYSLDGSSQRCYKRLHDCESTAEETPAKKFKHRQPIKSILKKTKSRRRFNTPRRTFFNDDNVIILEYATSQPPCEISYLKAIQSQMLLCFDDGSWFKQTVYPSGCDLYTSDDSLSPTSS